MFSCCWEGHCIYGRRMVLWFPSYSLWCLFPARFLCKGMLIKSYLLHFSAYSFDFAMMIMNFHTALISSWWYWIFYHLQVGIAGVPADTVMKKTRTLEDNWIPAWDEEFEFPLSVPELALLRIEVHEYDMSEKDDFGGQTCLPVSELKQGIRSVPLHNHKGEKYKSVKLLMRFEFIWFQAAFSRRDV